MVSYHPPSGPAEPDRSADLSPDIVEHIGALRRYSRALVGNRADADDLVQECLTRVLAQMRAWREVRDLRAYLFTTLHNVFVDNGRRKKAAVRAVSYMIRTVTEARQLLNFLAGRRVPDPYALAATRNESPVGAISDAVARAPAIQGEKVGVLLLDDEAAYFEDVPVEIFSLGADVAQAGLNLFAGLRELDKRDVDVILVRVFDRAGLGLAVYDRLLRAAEGRVIEID